MFAGAEQLQPAGEDLLQLHAADLLLYSLPLNTADWVLECCIVPVYYCACVHGQAFITDLCSILVLPSPGLGNAAFESGGCRHKL